MRAKKPEEPQPTPPCIAGKARLAAKISYLYFIRRQLGGQWCCFQIARKGPVYCVELATGLPQLSDVGGAKVLRVSWSAY